MRFDSIVVVDWAAGNDRGPRPGADATWTATVRDGALQDAIRHRNRDVLSRRLTGLLAEEMRAGRRVLAGFDFAFAYPAGFARALTGQDDPLALWDWFAANPRDDPKANTRLDLVGPINTGLGHHGPFWFNGLRREVPGLARRARSSLRGEARGRTARPRLLHGMADGGCGCRRVADHDGLPRLAALRRIFAGDLAVWPFEAPDRAIVLAEVRPSLIAEAVRAVADSIRDRAQVRLLADAIWRLQAEEGLERAFAAASGGPRGEGWILGVGVEERLRHHATRAAREISRRCP
jgi:molybdopterin molybdotransferase